MNKKKLFLILLFLLFPITVLAAIGGPLEAIINNIVSVIVFIGGAIVVILWIITGVLFLTALGAPEKLSAAKKALFASIGGTVLVILALAAETIISNILFRGV